LQAKVAGGGTIKLEGRAGPVNPADTAASPVRATLKISDLDLAGSGLTQTAPAIAGIISMDGAGQSDGKMARIDGSIKAEKLKLAKDGVPAKKPVQFDFGLDHNLGRHSGRLRKGNIHIGSAPATLTGTYADQGEIAHLQMELNGPNMAISELTELLPALAIVLPRGASLTGGTATVKVAMEGPLSRLVTNGSVSLDNTKITGFDMGRQLAFLQALSGIQAARDTEIQKLGASVHVSPEGTRVENLELVVPAIGTLDGAGTVSPANELAFQMRATVRGTTVPFLVQGTASEPAFRPDVKGMAKEGLKTLTSPDGVKGVKGLLDGILGGRKK
jgi:AsmA protein